MMATGLVGLVLAGAFLAITQPWSAESRHRRLNARIQEYLDQADVPFRQYEPNHQFFRVDTEHMSKPDRGRYEILRAVRTALANALWPSRSVEPAKFAAIGEWLDRNDGADLKTYEGCVELLKKCDEASWTFHDYVWITTLSEIEADGTIPALPKLGARWKDDERRKKYDGR